MTSKMALSMVLVVLCAGCTDKKETKASDVPAVVSRPSPSAATATAAPETAGPLVEATAQQLFIAYRQNEIGADAKYRNKLVRVIGEVTRVIRDGESGAFLFLDAPDVAKDTEVIRARFSEANDAGTLKDGDFATIRCRGKGLLGNQVQLESCALETHKNETPIPVTADQLCADFKKSKDDALIKYEGRPLLVSGSISRVGVSLMEAKDPPVVVFATTSGEMQARLDVDAPRSLKRGQKLTLRCSWDGIDFVTPLLGCTIPK